MTLQVCTNCRIAMLQVFLDALVFSSPLACFPDVFVGGKQAVQAGRVCGVARGSPRTAMRDPLWPQLAVDFTQAMKKLWD